MISYVCARGGYALRWHFIDIIMSGLGAKYVHNDRDAKGKGEKSRRLLICLNGVALLPFLNVVRVFKYFHLSSAFI